MSAFEADRFNHSRTSPRRTTKGVLRAKNALRISAAGSPPRVAQGDARSTPQLSRLIPRQARDFNHSRRSPREKSYQLSGKPRFLASLGMTNAECGKANDHPADRKKASDQGLTTYD